MIFIDFLLKHYELVRQSEIHSVSSVYTHSGKVKKNSLFIAIKGRAFDGHDYLHQAVQQGAVILLVENTDNIPLDFKGFVLRYKDKMKSLPQLLNTFYNQPSEKLFTVGVTGTNGKTSFCYLLEKIFQDCGWPTAVMGTIDQHFEKHNWLSPLTTPSSSDIFERLNDFVQLEARSLIMEVSSHALDQNRVQGIDFKALVFTNLTQDHLDYHNTMEEYYQSKKKLFTQMEQQRNKNFFCLVNQDDDYGRRLKKEIRSSCYTYGQDSDSDFCFHIKERSQIGSVFELRCPFGSVECSLPLLGEYSIYNAVSALSCALLTGFKAEDSIKALKNFSGVPGRLQKLASGRLPFDVFVDYAHTPEALACVLKTLKPYGNKLKVLFGCGGDRDKGKRIQMLSRALLYADQIFFTTDNPRFEEPEQIAEQALQKASEKEKQKIIVELDRKTAIKKALQSGQKGDVLLVAGKGHEAFQIVKDKKIPFSDEQVILASIKELGL